MPLTPEDVSNKRFTPVRLREGYDMGEVDQFLDEVEAELARLTKENDDLRSKLSAAQTGGGAGFQDTSSTAQTPAVQERAPEPPPAPEPDAGPGPGRRARRCRAPAPRRSGSRPSRRRPTPPPGCSRSPPATPTSSSSQAKNEADKIIGEARTKSERLESESKVKADRLESDARTRAQMLDSETAERRQQMFGELERERDKLNSEVETLRAFEREYRSRLKSYFSQQLEALSGPGESPAVSDEQQPAPKRLRSILGDDEV